MLELKWRERNLPINPVGVIYSSKIKSEQTSFTIQQTHCQTKGFDIKPKLENHFTQKYGLVNALLRKNATGSY